MTTSRDAELQSVVDKSGLPLQIAIASQIASSTGPDAFRVLYAEHAWKLPDLNERGFIDLVLEDSRRTTLLAVECKRVLDTDWIFLIPQNERKKRSHAEAWLSYGSSIQMLCYDWADVTCSPDSHESSYCIIPKRDSKATSILETLASDLVNATEALAHEEYQFLRGHDALRMLLSVIVTTARLKTCVFDPNNVSIIDGVMAEAAFEEVPFIRFRKQLTSDYSTIDRQAPDPRALQVQARERTVFVVNSGSLAQFLSLFSVDSGSAQRAVMERHQTRT